MSNASVTDTATVSAGWQSDDEPPQDQPGDLTPLTVQGHHSVTALKAIVNVGDTFQPAADADEVEADLCFLLTGKQFTLQSRLSSLRGMGYIEALCANGIQYMKIGETADIWIQNKHLNDHLEMLEKPNPKQLKRLQTLRRRFAQANSEGTQWGLVEQSSYTRVASIKLKNVVRRYDFGNGMSKVIITQGYSWNTPKLTSSLEVKIAPLDQKSSLQEVINACSSTIQQEERKIRLDTFEPPLRALLMSLKVGETSILEWECSDYAEAFHRCFAMTSGAQRVLITLLAIEDETLYYIMSPKACSDFLMPREESQKMSDALGTLTLLSHHDKKVNDMLRSHDLRGSAGPNAGTMVVVEIIVDDDKIALLFVVDRSRGIDGWLHALTQLLKRGQQYSARIDFDGLEKAAEAFATPTNVVATTRLDGLKFIKKDKCCPYIQHSGLHGLEISPSPLGFIVSTAALSNDISMILQSDNTADWLEFKSKHFTTQNITFDIAVIAELGQEILAWDGTPVQVWSHAIYMLKESEDLAMNNYNGLACHLAQASEQLLRQLMSRTLDGDFEDLSFIANEGFEAVDLESLKPDIVPNILNLSPVFAERYLGASKYLCAWIHRSLGNLKVAHDLLTLIKLTGTEALPKGFLLRKRMIELKAILEYQLKMSEECRDTCLLEETPSLSKLLIWAKNQAKEHQKQSKALYQKMFQLS